MATKRWILFLPLAAMVSVLAGCSSGTSNVQNPPPPPPSKVTIAFQPEPGGSLAVSFSENLTAVVSNDPNNYGVDWNLVCQSGAGTCGSLTVNGLGTSHTASGAAITYTAPSALSTNSMVVEIVAFATADQNKNVVAPITISTFNSSLQAGNYVLQAQGIDSNSNPYQFAGVITLDGQGNITGGEQTVNSGGVSLTDSILPVGSSYFLGSDGRGTITLNDTSAGTETFAFVFLSTSQNPHALISQMNLGTAAIGASATGTMDLQQTGVIAAPSGSYAFVMSGTDVLDSLPLAFGGVFNIPSGQTAISGVTDEIIATHVKVSDGQFLAGSQLSSGPDTLGQVTFKLIGLLDAKHTKPVTVILTGYIVDPTHIKLIESDNNSGTGFGVTGGLALSQAAGSYGNFNFASLSGNYVFGVTGVDLYQANSISSTSTAAGLFTADGLADESLTSGFTDTFLQLNCVQLTCKTGGTQGAQISSSFSGAYSVDSNGTGRTTLNGVTFLSNPPRPSYNPQLFLYLTGNASPEPAALVLAAGDMVQPNEHYGSIGTGIAYAQSNTTPAFSGPYGFSFTQQNGSENDGTAQLNANPTGTPQVSGIADANLGGGPSQDNGFLGTFNNPTPDAPFSGTLYADPNAVNGNVFPLVGVGVPMTVDYYFIDSGHGFWIETDLVSQSSTQVSFGYYVTRTPVCTGCP